MGRKYAGTLGPIAFITVVARNVMHGGNTDTALLTASAALFAFAALGYFLGRLADGAVKDAVESTLQRQLRARDGARSGTAGDERTPRGAGTTA